MQPVSRCAASASRYLPRKTRESACTGNRKPRLRLPMPLVATPAADQAMHMRMMLERLRPGVQHQGESQFAAEPARVMGKPLQGLGCRIEQQAVQQPSIGTNQSIECMRQGEHHMEVRHGQQLRTLSIQPLFLGARLTLRAMSVTAGVIVIVLVRRTRAGCDMPAHRLGAAGGNRAQYALLATLKPCRSR